MHVNDDVNISIINQEIYKTSFLKMDYKQVVDHAKYANILL